MDFLNFKNVDIKCFRRYSWQRSIIIFQAMILLPLTILAVRLFGLRWWQSCLGSRVGSFSRHDIPSDQTQRIGEAHQIAQLVTAASRRQFVRPTCLHRSLVLWHILQRRGIQADLVIGVKFDRGKFAAHAWVTSGDVILIDLEEEISSFRPFDQPIAPRDTP